MNFTLRVATRDDVAAIENVMKDSLAGLSSRTYDPAQVHSSLEYIGHIDPFLIDDGTYFVAEAKGEIVGCGGWSKRRKLYRGSGSADSDGELMDPERDAAKVRAMFVATGWARRGIGRAILARSEDEARRAGFHRVELMAMLSAIELYLSSGYAEVEAVDAKLEDGTPYPLVRMVKELV